jgi:hypothetical protein
MTWTTSEGIVERCRNLVRLASTSDSPERLLIAASRQLRRPLVLLDAGGTPLAAPPPSAGLDRSVAALAAGIADPDAAPEGWQIIPIENERERLAFIAVHDVGAGETEQAAMLDLIVSLLGDQLERAALASTIRSERQAALLRRLVTDPTITPVEIRSEASAAGVRLADSYWPALLVWTAGHPGPRTLAELCAEAERQAPGSITVQIDNITVALLLPARASGVANGEDIHHKLTSLVGHVRQLGHRDVRAIARERSVGLAQLAARLGELERLQRYLPLSATGALVRPARTFALARLLNEGLDRRRAQAFVRGRIGRLLHHDQDHGTDLAHVLELALDFPRRDDAARASYMHRNTFRRRLTQALELIDADLNDPDDRLALHVALRLRRLLNGQQRAAAGTGESAERVTDPRRGARARRERATPRPRVPRRSAARLGDTPAVRQT